MKNMDKIFKNKKWYINKYIYIYIYIYINKIEKKFGQNHSK
ncbi:hypothetical protein ACMBCM_09535 [Spiroplasma sp. K1]